jgi:hypothetical protein
MNNRDKGFIIIFFTCLILLFNSCIEPLKPDLDKSDLELQLVVEGQLTDEPGPFKVRLTKSGSVYTEQDVYKVEPVNGADVHISDDKGNDFHLFQGENGWYETTEKCLQGIPGNTYTLQITNQDGTRYESTPEMMHEGPPVDSVFYEKEQRTLIKEEMVSQEEYLTILLNTRAKGDGINYFKWEFEETWEFKMPEYIEIVNAGIDEQGNPFKSKSMKTVDVASEKLHCWGSETSKSILIKSTADNLVGEIRRFPLTSIGPEEDRLGIRYSILVKQYRISKELYIFFEKLRNLNETNAGIYDKIPGPVYGNIKYSSGNKYALGYFFASSVKSKRIFIDQADVHVNTRSAYFNCQWDSPQRPYVSEYFYGLTDSGNAYVWSADKNCTDCRERGTNAKPDYW